MADGPRPRLSDNEAESLLSHPSKEIHVARVRTISKGVQDVYVHPSEVDMFYQRVEAGGQA